MFQYREDLDKNKFSIFIAPRTKIHTHSHNFLEFVYVLKGEALHTHDGNTINIKEGDYFVIDYGSKHSYKAITEELELINCLFSPDFIDAQLANCNSLQMLVSGYQIHFKNEFFTANPSATMFFDENQRIKNLLFDILSEYSEKASGYLQVIRSKIIEILILTIRKIYVAPNSDSAFSDMDKILEYISHEYMNNISLGDICHKFGYSFSYLSAKFKKETGVNFTQFLQKTRAEQSMRLLAYTNTPINEIAAIVGYKDIKAFYAVFKKITNTTPAKFRKNFHK